MGTPVIRRAHREIGRNGFIYIGEHLVYEPDLERRPIKRLSERKSRRLSVGTVSGQQNLGGLYRKIRESSSPIVKRNLSPRSFETETRSGRSIHGDKVQFLLNRRFSVKN